jgi:hypothetical protein
MFGEAVSRFKGGIASLGIGGKREAIGTEY